MVFTQQLFAAILGNPAKRIVRVSDSPLRVGFGYDRERIQRLCPRLQFCIGSLEFIIGLPALGDIAGNSVHHPVLDDRGDAPFEPSIRAVFATVAVFKTKQILAARDLFATLAIAIKSQSPTQPIVMLTAYPEKLQSRENPLTEVDLFICKPFDIESLREAIISFSLA